MWPRIKWIDTKIEHHGSNTDNKKCVVVIPAYRQDPKFLEKESLKQVVTILGSKYELVLVCPTALNIDTYNKIADYDFSVLRCNSDFFKSQKTYSDLCEMWQFYNAFSEYEFMLIYQLDAWIFEDKIDYFIEKGYDYIGAPHLITNEKMLGENGNGGFCLRRIKPFLEVTKKTDFTKHTRWLEDCAFTKELKDNFNLAPIELCREFSFQEIPHVQYERNGNRLPMGCHAFMRFNEAFWKQHISAYNNPESKEENKDVTSYIVNSIYGPINRVNKFIPAKRRVIRKQY